MTQDRAEIVKEMAEAMHRTDRPHDTQWTSLPEQTRLAYRVLASAALDIALKAAAEIARGRVVHGNFRTWDFWNGGNCHEADLPAIHSDEIAAAILALTSEGTKP